MNKLKFRIERKHLLKLCIVLDQLLNTPHDIEKLGKVQLSAARIVTGLPIFASRESPYTETGWQTLQKQTLCKENDYSIQNLQWLFPTLG